jgi:heptosyltransferase II
MSGSSESASGTASDARNVLICAPNWIGDAIMSMPALQLLRRRDPAARLVLLSKPRLAGLWGLHGAVDDLLPVEAGWAGSRRTARRIRAGRFERALILPNSFRAALLPFLAGVPERWGAPGHWRRAMLNAVVRPGAAAARRHQAWEMARILVPGYRGDALPPPHIAVPTERLEAARAEFGLDGDWVVLMPGAARGPSKRWPADRYAEVGRRLARAGGVRVAVMGSAGEELLCRTVAESIGPAARPLAGTSIPVWAAILTLARAAVANDSGGAHLSAAVGTPVAVVCGLTDPSVTGPLGGPVRIVREGGGGSRDIPRDSARARKTLERIPADAVYEALREMEWDHGKECRSDAR